VHLAIFAAVSAPSPSLHFGIYGLAMSRVTHAIKAAIRRSANRLGYDLVQYDTHNARWRLNNLLAVSGVTVALDVGANEGNFGHELRELGFDGKIVSFEPLADAYRLLVTAAASDASWTAVNIGLGERDEERVLHVAANSQSSSFLAMEGAHTQAAPDSAYIGETRANIRRLDGVFAQYCPPNTQVFLKIDTQGFEKRVMEGARGVLDRVPLIQLECSLVPLYQDADLIEDLLSYMRGLGYDPVDQRPTFYHRDSHHLMQLDVLFLRR
jgi:FkbM family methyltransferase